MTFQTFAGARVWFGLGSEEAWGDDPVLALRRSRRRYAVLAACAGVLAGLEAVALAALAPLKTVVPYTILVDRQTGYVESVKGLRPGPLTQDEAIIQSALVQYVIARETFDAADLRENFMKVTLWTASDARTRYVEAMRRSNPDSPVNQYPPSTVLSTRIRTVSIIAPGSAVVRFDTVRRDSGAVGGEQRSWSATVGYRFTGSPMRMEDRFLDPLGFQVLSYRRDAESLAPTPVRFDGQGSGTP
jgi:type IV secretion system protein VirB8